MDRRYDREYVIVRRSGVSPLMAAGGLFVVVALQCGEL